MIPRWCIVGMVAGAAVAGSGAALQPPATEPDRANLRERLVIRLNEANRTRERIEAALKRLDDGAPVGEVRAEAFRPGEGRLGGSDLRRDRRPPGPPGPRAGDQPGDPEADRRLVMGFLERYNPEMAQRMKAALESDAEGAGRWIMRMAPRVRELMTERDEQLREMRIAEFRNGQQVIEAARRLAGALREGNPEAPAAESARQALREALGQQFDIRMTIRRREIAALEERLEQLRAEVRQHEGSRDAFVNDKLEEIRRAAREWVERDHRSGTPPRR